MIKKILSVVMAMLTVSALTATAFAYEFSYGTYISLWSTSRDFTAKTKVTRGGNVDIITAGLKCLRTDTGDVVGSGDFSSLNDAIEVDAFQSIGYSYLSVPVRGFGSHSAYKNGQTVLYKFTQTEKAA